MAARGKKPSRRVCRDAKGHFKPCGGKSKASRKKSKASSKRPKASSKKRKASAKPTATQLRTLARRAPGKTAKNKRVSACISQKIREESWPQRRAVAACLNMERARRLTDAGAYVPKVRRKRRGARNVATGDVDVGGCGCGG